jgi:hypothetical protein
MCSTRVCKKCGKERKDEEEGGKRKLFYQSSFKCEISVEEEKKKENKNKILTRRKGEIKIQLHLVVGEVGGKSSRWSLLD